jgi:CubicO group peptidase (beta-lactamase class C family)
MTPEIVTLRPGGPEPAGRAAVPWWSFGKTVLAVAALTLVRDGLARIDEPVVGDARLGDLLQHRAGFPDYGDVAAYHAAVAAGEAAWPIERLLAAVGPRSDRRRWHYSNVGYLHVRRWLEAKTGSSLDALLGARLFRPLGLTRSRVAVMPGDLAGVVGVRHGYDPNWVYHGLVVGPLAEAARLLDALARGRILPADLFAVMRGPLPLGTPLPGRPWRAPAYGLGLMLEEAAPTAYGHTGGGPGSVVAVYHEPLAGITRAAFLADADRPADAGAVERAALPSPETSA